MSRVANSSSAAYGSRNVAMDQVQQSEWSEIKMASGLGQGNNSDFYSRFHLFQYHSA